MLTFTVVSVTVLSLLIAAALIVLAGGAGVVLAFSDLIVCALIIWLLVKLFRRRK